MEKLGGLIAAPEFGSVGPFPPKIEFGPLTPPKLEEGLFWFCPLPPKLSIENVGRPITGSEGSPILGGVGTLMFGLLP